MRTNRKLLTNAQTAATRDLKAAAEKLWHARVSRDEALAAWHDEFNASVNKGDATVPDLAQACAVERNYIDQARVRAGLPKLRDLVIPETGDTPEQTEAKRQAACERAATAAAKYRSLDAKVDEALQERNDLAIQVYRSDVLGPTAISKAVGVDRNHVQRLNRSYPGFTPRPRSANGAKAASKRRDRAAKPAGVVPSRVTAAADRAAKPSANPFSEATS